MKKYYLTGISILFLIACSIVVMAETDFSSDNNLIMAHYFENSSIEDNKGNYDGTDVSTTNVSGLIGSARDFGANKYIQLQDSENIFGAAGNTGTIILWTKATSVGNEDWIMGKWGWGNNELLFKTQNGNHLSALVETWGGYAEDNAAFPENTWNMVALRWNSSNFAVFINTTQEGVNSVTRQTSEGGPLFIGCNPDGNVSFWESPIDEVSIWNRSLTQAEIEQVHACGADGTHILDCGAGAADTCTYTSGDWEISLSDNCVLESDTDIGANDIIITGDAGSLTIKSEIRANNIKFEPDDFDGDSVIAIESGGLLGFET